MNPRYSRYESDRRSRSPRERSPADRFDRGAQFADDHRRSSVDSRSNAAAFQSNRDSFADNVPPRGPKALINAPSGPRGGGFASDFRGRGRGRGRGGWPPRDDSRDRGRERENIDFRDRYREERSRGRERDRERDRDWRDPVDFNRGRRSPPMGRRRSPPRDFRDREGPPPLGIDSDRPRRGSRDGGPPSAGSASSDPQFGGPPFSNRGGGFGRGRGRGGRGDWPERNRARIPFDERNERYPRSRSPEARWGRDRDDRDRMSDPDVRRESRDERDRPAERENFRAKLEARGSVATGSETSARPVKETTPPPPPLPPAAPPAPAFSSAATGSGKLPPTAPRAFGEQQTSSMANSAPNDDPQPPTGPAKSSLQDNPLIPNGPRAHQKPLQRPTSKQWINPVLKKPPESPKLMRSQSFAQSQQLPPFGLRQEGSQLESRSEDRRPRSSDAKSDSNRFSSHRRTRDFSAEPGEIIKNEESQLGAEAAAFGIKFSRGSGEGESATGKPLHAGDGKMPKDSTEAASSSALRAKPSDRHPYIPVVRFSLPPKPAPLDQGCDSDDDDEDMIEYFETQIKMAEAELEKLQVPPLPVEIVARFAAMSHGSMVKILNDSEGFTKMLGDIPEGLEIPPRLSPGSKPVEVPGLTEAMTLEGDAAKLTVKLTVDVEKREASDQDGITSPREAPQTKAEAMDVDEPGITAPMAPGFGPTQSKKPLLLGSGPGSGSGSGSAVEPPKEKQSVTTDVVPTVEDHFMRDAEDNLLSSNTAGEESKPPSTPSQVEDDGDDETESEDEAYLNAQCLRQTMTTPPLDSLPDYGTDVPWDKDPEVLASFEPEPSVEDLLRKHLSQMNLKRKAEQMQEKQHYSEHYTQYLRFTNSDDPVAVKSRSKFNVAATSPDPVVPVVPEPPKPEGRGTGRKYASERDLERVIQASMREDEERRERELRMQQEKYRSDKEAVIPDMYWTHEQRDEEIYIDRTGFISQDRMVAAWHLLPPINNFTEEETALFEKRYLEVPKQWGKIAEVTPRRNFGSCIQFYYMTKKELNLKEKLKKQPKKRKKGRGKQRSSALVSELGNADADGEDNNEVGENGERKRPRRAAAPTWNFEQPIAEIDPAAAASTPGRRGAAGAKGDQPEKMDGRKGRRKPKEKEKDKDKDKDKDKERDKEGKSAKSAHNLTVASVAAKGRTSRSGSRAPNVEFQHTMAADLQRSAQFERQPIAAGMQPPFSIQQPPDRPPPLAASMMSEVMAPPSLRPEPPSLPQSAMSTFNLASGPQERKAPTQASSYWSVSESNDFPQLLRAFGTDWNAIAAHMGSKTAVMVKNYYVRQKDSGKAEWEMIAQEADAKRLKGEKLPDPPQPSTAGRGRRYETTTSAMGRPLALTPGMELQAESPAKIEPVGPAGRNQPFSSYGVPIAQAPNQSGQQLMVMQHGSQASSQAMSPSMRPLRAPLTSFGFPEREREDLAPKTQPADPRDIRDQRPLAAAQNSQSASNISERQREQLRIRQQQQQQMEERDRERERQERERQERDRERELEMLRPVDRQPLMMKQDLELNPQRSYEPFGHRQHGGHTQPPRHDPLALSRAPKDPQRAPTAAPSFSSGPPPPGAEPVSRSLLSDLSPTQPAPTPMPVSRPVSTVPQRHEPYGLPPSTTSTPTPTSSLPRPAEPPRKSNIMSLLNDDPAPAPRNSVPPATSSPQPMARPPPPPPLPPTTTTSSSGPSSSHVRRETESQFSPYGRSSGGAAAMPSLKPTYSSSSNQHMSGPRSSAGLAADSPRERDYYRQPTYQSGHHSGGPNTPQESTRYTPAGHSGHSQYPSSSSSSSAAYPTPYSSVSQGRSVGSPPPSQYGGHAPSHRGHEQDRRDWTPQTAPSNWSSQPPKASQPPPSHVWSGQQSQSGVKAGQPGRPGSWAASSEQPPPHLAHREDRNPPLYGSPRDPLGQQQQQQHQHQQHPLPGRYQPSTSRGPEPGPPPPSQAYPRYASTPGPGPAPPRDPREIPGRSYTPGVYDTRGPPPPSSTYANPDPRDHRDRREVRGDPRDPRDPRNNIMGGGLRPQEYDRHPDQYRR